MKKCEECKVQLQDYEVYHVANGWENYCKRCADKLVEELKRGDDTSWWGQ